MRRHFVAVQPYRPDPRDKHGLKVLPAVGGSQFEGADAEPAALRLADKLWRSGRYAGIAVARSWWDTELGEYDPAPEFLARYGRTP